MGRLLPLRVNAAELATRRALRRDRSRAEAQPRGHFGHAAERTVKDKCVSRRDGGLGFVRAPDGGNVVICPKDHKPDRVWIEIGFRGRVRVLAWVSTPSVARDARPIVTEINRARAADHAFRCIKLTGRARVSEL